MATDSDIKLTRFKSTATVVTADFANSIFGGLHGSSEAADLSEDDPRVRGHVHDGINGDGHAPRVDLVEHVEGKLENQNLADDAVTKRNVLDTVDVSSAIPEYRYDSDSGKTYYYLDLRHIRADLTFQEDDDPAGDGSQHSLVRQRSTTFDGDTYIDIPDVWTDAVGRDFVFGSSSLDDLGLADSSGQSRFQFDKSNYSFRAGKVTGGQWNEAVRGEGSVAIGLNSQASGTLSTVSGGQHNEASGFVSTVSGGQRNKALGLRSTVSGGLDNEATETRSVVSGGENNKAYAEGAVIVGGKDNLIESLAKNSTIVGGLTNTIINGCEYSFIAGSGNKIGTVASPAVVTAAYALGANNTVDSNNSFSFGILNVIGVASENSVILGGHSSSLSQGSSSSIIGGYGCTLNGDNNIILGGDLARVDAMRSIVCGSGGAGDPLGIGGYDYLSKGGRIIPKSPAEYSGIYGGRGCYINGGTDPDPKEGNFIIASLKSSIGAEGANVGVSSNSILASLDSEIGVISGADKSKIETSSIIGGVDNWIYLGGHPGADTTMMLSGILGGYRNSINVHREIPTTDWFEPYYNGFVATESEYGIQTSWILGGSQNIITNSISKNFEHNSLYSTIVGGNKNLISSSMGSTIIGGGAFVDARSGGSTSPPYDTIDFYEPNIIVQGHHSTILNGSSNYIGTYTFPFLIGGPWWISAGTPGKGLQSLPEPIFSTAEGRESHSYLYGQNASSSGGHSWIKFYNQGFLPGAVEYSGPPGSAGAQPDFHTVIGAPWNSDKKIPKTMPGSAQNSTLNLFGSFNYSKSEILDPPIPGGTFYWKPAGSSAGKWWFDFRANLDGGLDAATVPDPILGSVPNRSFIPRYIGSYSIVINGHIRYTDFNAGGSSGIGTNGILRFTYKGYIIFQPDGGGLYGGEITDYMSSDGTTVDLLKPGGAWYGSASDFYLAFCPEYDLTTSAVVDPNTAYGVAKGEGKWPAPPHAIADKAWPPHFSLYVVNDSGDKSVTGGSSGTGRELIGESVVAKLEVTEDLFFLGKYENPAVPP